MLKLSIIRNCDTFLAYIFRTEVQLCEKYKLYYFPRSFSKNNLVIRNVNIAIAGYLDLNINLKTPRSTKYLSEQKRTKHLQR